MSQILPLHVSLNTEEHKLKDTGIKLVQEEMPKEAIRALEAYLDDVPEDGLAQSYLGLAYTMNQDGKRGLQLCREAAENYPFESEIQKNLGQVYLRAGRRQLAWETFVLASRLDRENQDVDSMMQMMGKRRPPVFPGLKRSHPLNVWTGRLLARIGLR